MAESMDKHNCVFVVRITLNSSKPPIWQWVAVPADITLGMLA